MKTHKVNHLGVARTFQNIRLFPALTALENVKIGVETRQRSGPVAAMLGLPRQRREEKQSTIDAFALLDAVGLADRPNELAGSLPTANSVDWRSPGRSAPIRASLLLDEPAAGTNPVEKRELAQLIQRINLERDISVLLIEHDMKLVMSVAHRIVVLNFGEKIAEGTPQAIQRNPAVIAAYLGTSAEEVEAGRGAPAGHHAPHRDGRPDGPRGGAMTDAAAPELLEVVDLEVRYGAIRAIKGISFHVGEGEIVALLGANGAGKTTTQKTISGMLRPSAGRITFLGAADRRRSGPRAHPVGHLPRAGRSARVPPDDGRREPRDGCVSIQED